jgi:L,D-transpeptidase ErfK/SrfK
MAVSVTARAAFYPMPSSGNDIVGKLQVIRVQKEDNVNELMRKYEVSYHELLEANPEVRFSSLQKGEEIVIPTQFVLPKYRKGIVINIPELRLYYFTPDGQSVFTAPVGLGRSGWRTPTMTTYVIKKEKNPVWHVPKDIVEYAESMGQNLPNEIPPGKDNPLGDYALYLSYSGYLLHGTNDPDSVGRYASSGCIRLSSETIAMLYSEVNVGTIVHIIHASDKVGWSNSVLYLEKHVSVSYDVQEGQREEKQSEAKSVIREAIKNRPINIDWQKVDDIENQQTGIPEPISSETSNKSDNNSYDF